MLFREIHSHLKTVFVKFYGSGRVHPFIKICHECLLQISSRRIVAGRSVRVLATGGSPSSSVGVLTGRGSVRLSGVLSATVYMGVCGALDRRDTANVMFRKLYKLINKKN